MPLNLSHVRGLNRESSAPVSISSLQVLVESVMQKRFFEITERRGLTENSVREN